MSPSSRYEGSQANRKGINIGNRYFIVYLPNRHKLPFGIDCAIWPTGRNVPDASGPVEGMVRWQIVAQGDIVRTRQPTVFEDGTILLEL
jgi:hypothetical protein